MDKFYNLAFPLSALFKGDTQKNLQNWLNSLFDTLQGKGGDLFDEDDNRPRNFAEAVKKVFGIEYKPAKGERHDDEVRGGNVDGDQSDGLTRGPEFDRNARGGGRVSQGAGATEFGGGAEGVSEGRGEGGRNTDPIPELEWSEEKASNGEPFLLGKNGDTNLVKIPDIIFERIGIEPMPLRLTPSMINHVRL